MVATLMEKPVSSPSRTRHGPSTLVQKKMLSMEGSGVPQQGTVTKMKNGANALTPVGTLCGCRFNAVLWLSRQSCLYSNNSEKFDS